MEANWEIYIKSVLKTCTTFNLVVMFIGMYSKEIIIHKEVFYKYVH